MQNTVYFVVFPGIECFNFFSVSVQSLFLVANNKLSRQKLTGDLSLCLPTTDELKGPIFFRAKRIWLYKKGNTRQKNEKYCVQSEPED